MAFTPNGDPLGDDATTGASTPNEAAPPSGKLDESVDNLRDVDVLVNKINELMDVLKNNAEATAESFEETSTSAEDLVNKMGSIRDRVKLIADYSKKLGQNLGGKTFAQALAEVQKMRQETERLLKLSKDNSQENIAYGRILRSLVEDEKKLKEHKSDSNKMLKTDVDLMKQLGGHTRNVQEDLLKFTNALSSVKTGKLNQAFLSISGVLGRGGGHIENLKRKAQNAHEIKESRKEKTKDNQNLYAARKTAVEDKLRAAGLDVFDSSGRNVDQNKFRKNKQARDIALDTITAGPNGERAGWLDRRLASMAIGGKEGGLADRLMSPLEAGGGSVIEGVTGGVEGLGAGAVSKLAGPAGLAAAGVLAIKDVWDAGAKQNQGFEKTLGGGGVFSGSTGGIEGLNNARDNLRAWGLNKFRVSQERNLAVAQAMQESGVSLSGLANKGTGMRDSGVGDIANIAMKQAREIGLTDVEGTKQTLKMLQNYKMTLDGTQTFFRTVGKDITAAGLSTGKYLQLLDDVTGQFDSMGKSIETVTTTLRAMGNEGTETGDQLKENFTALLGKPQTDEQSLFGMSTMSEPNFQKAVKATQKNAEDAVQNYMKSIGEAISHANLPQESYETIWKGLDLTKSKDLDIAKHRWEEMKMKNGIVSSPLTTQIGTTELTAKNAVAKAEHYKRGRYYAAGSQGITDDTAISRMTSTMNNLSNALEMSGSSTDDLVENGVGGMDPLLLKKMSDATGLDPHKIQQINQGVGDISDSIVDELGSGLSAASTKGMDRNAIYAQHLRDINVKDFDPTKAEEIYRRMYNTDSADLKLKSHKALMQPGALDEALTDKVVSGSMAEQHKETWEQQEKKVSEMSLATSTTNELLGDVVTALTGVGDSYLLQILDFIKNPAASLIKGASGEVSSAWEGIKTKAGTWLGDKTGNNAWTQGVKADFQKMGMSEADAAAMAANFWTESSGNIHAEGDYKNGKPTAYGAAQWHPDRQKDFKDFTGIDIHDSSLAQQEAFALHELTTTRKRAGDALSEATTPFDKGAAVSKFFETPADEIGQAMRRGALAASLMSNAQGSGAPTYNDNRTHTANTWLGTLLNAVTPSSNPMPSNETAHGAGNSQNVTTPNSFHDLYRHFKDTVEGHGA